MPNTCLSARLAGAAAGALLLAAAAPASAQTQTLGETVAYEIAGESFEGYVARNPMLEGDLPVVVLVHDWDGLGDYERARAEMLAQMGYAVLALDLYGEGVRPTDVEDKRAHSGALYKDRERMRSLVDGGIAALLGEGMDPERAVLAGYCFGGQVALEMARAGRDMDGFVSFHGGLGTPEGQDYAEVAGPLLILHGTADPVAPMEQVAELAALLDEAGAPYTMELYGGVDHAFTVWGGERYHGRADLESWEAFTDFLEERL
jgi:dienelactone hydrolase